MKPKEEALTVGRLRELLDYSPETGVLLWKVSQGAAKAGSVAGHRHGKGYRAVTVAGRLYLSHRLAWLYVHGEWPKECIDHVNSIRDDNRMVNLREATNQENLFNQRKASTNSKTCLLGTAWNKRARKYVANIKISRKQIYLGYYITAEEAHQAYLVAKRKLHSHCTI